MQQCQHVHFATQVQYRGPRFPPFQRKFDSGTTDGTSTLLVAMQSSFSTGLSLSIYAMDHHRMLDGCKARLRRHHGRGVQPTLAHVLPTWGSHRLNSCLNRGDRDPPPSLMRDTERVSPRSTLRINFGLTLGPGASLRSSYPNENFLCVPSRCCPRGPYSHWTLPPIDVGPRRGEERHFDPVSSTPLWSTFPLGILGSLVLEGGLDPVGSGRCGETSTTRVHHNAWICDIDMCAAFRSFHSRIKRDEGLSTGRWV